MPDGNTQSVIGTGQTGNNFFVPPLASIGKLAEALAAAQGEIKGAIKASDNPHFRSKYADLAAVWTACRTALSKHKLAVTQTTHKVDGIWVLRTTLVHASGESTSGDFPIMPLKQDMQGFMGALTYAKRGGLASMVGVAAEDEDDDGNTAAGHTSGATIDKSPPAQVKKSALPADPAPAVKASVTKWVDAQLAILLNVTSMDGLLAWENETDGQGESNLRKMDRITGSVYPLQGNRLKGEYLRLAAELNPANG